MSTGYFLENAEEWWDMVWNAGFRRMVGQLQLKDAERFKREHLQEVHDQRRDQARYGSAVHYLHKTGETSVTQESNSSHNWEKLSPR